MVLKKCTNYLFNKLCNYQKIGLEQHLQVHIMYFLGRYSMNVKRFISLLDAIKLHG